MQIDFLIIMEVQEVCSYKVLAACFIRINMWESKMDNVYRRGRECCIADDAVTSQKKPKPSGEYNETMPLNWKKAGMECLNAGIKHKEMYI